MINDRSPLVTYHNSRGVMMKYRDRRWLLRSKPRHKGAFITLWRAFSFLSRCSQFVGLSNMASSLSETEEGTAILSPLLDVEAPCDLPDGFQFLCEVQLETDRIIRFSGPYVVKQAAIEFTPYSNNLNP